MAQRRDRSDEMTPTAPRERGRVQRRARSPLRNLSVGAIADATARAVGSPGFLIGLTVFIIVWIGVNWYAPKYLHWDTHELLLLNLCFSILSSYSSPLILMAENRQLARDEVAAENDRENLRQQRVDMQFLVDQVQGIVQQLPDYSTRDDIDDMVRDAVDSLRQARRERAMVPAASGDADPAAWASGASEDAPAADAPVAGTSHTGAPATNGSPATPGGLDTPLLPGS